MLKLAFANAYCGCPASATLPSGSRPPVSFIHFTSYTRHLQSCFAASDKPDIWTHHAVLTEPGCRLGMPCHQYVPGTGTCSLLADTHWLAQGSGSHGLPAEMLQMHQELTSAHKLVAHLKIELDAARSQLEIFRWTCLACHLLSMTLGNYGPSSHIRGECESCMRLRTTS